MLNFIAIDSTTVQDIHDYASLIFLGHSVVSAATTTIRQRVDYMSLNQH